MAWQIYGESELIENYYGEEKKNNNKTALMPFIQMLHTFVSFCWAINANMLHRIFQTHGKGQIYRDDVP